MATFRVDSPPRLQRGRTLIELVIAMAIGLVIVIGVGSLYISSSGISRTANQVAHVEQAGQLAMLMIGESLKLAGYGEFIGTDFAAQGQTLFDGAHIRGCTGSRFVDPFPAPVLPPNAPTPPDLSCAGAVAQDALYVRFQARPVIAPMTAAEADRITVWDCLAQSNVNQDETIDPSSLRAGSGTTRRMVSNVYQFDPVNGSLDCRGRGGAAFGTLLTDVDQFRVFYRFDDAAHAAGASGVTNAAPLGGSVRDATFINGLAGTVDPWNYVVAVMVCLRVRTNEVGVGSAPTNNETPRCPTTAAEAETGVALVGTTTDGRLRRTFSHVFTVRSRATASPSLTL